MGDKATLAVQVDKQSDLYDDFEEYKQRGGFTSTSETLRHLMREEFEEDDETPVGVAAAVSQIAGEQVTRSMDLLAKYLIVTAAALIAFNAGVFGGVVWAGVAAVYATLSLLTFIAVGAGVAEVVNPDGVASSSATGSGDEVDA
jgi:hypothetical protein